jgi:hypothetical protein
LLFYFVIPTTDYYRIDITPSSIGSIYGGYSAPDIDVNKVKGDGSWEETYETQQFIFNSSQELINQELSDRVSSSEYSSSHIDGTALALRDMSNRIRILVSVKHKRSFNPEKVFKELRNVSSIYDIERLQREYDIEVKAAVL